MKKSRKIVTLLITLMVLFTSFIINEPICAEELYYNNKDIQKMDCIQPYIKILDEINQKYGTSMSIPTEEIIKNTGMDRHEVLDYYLSQDLSQFRKNMITLYKESEKKNNDVLKKDVPGVEVFATTKKQRFVFTNGDYLYVKMLVYYAEGANRYSDFISYGYTNTRSPFYAPYKVEYQYANGQKEVAVAFYCYKYYAPNVLCSTTPITFIGYFSASGGDCEVLQTV